VEVEQAVLLFFCPKELFFWPKGQKIWWTVSLHVLQTPPHP
jgi:hypothetical protein